jgi:hypothetical protein
VQVWGVSSSAKITTTCSRLATPDPVDIKPNRQKCPRTLTLTDSPPINPFSMATNLSDGAQAGFVPEGTHAQEGGERPLEERQQQETVTTLTAKNYDIPKAMARIFSDQEGLLFSLWRLVIYLLEVFGLKKSMSNLRIDESENVDLDRAATMGNFPSRPSDLFLKVYLVGIGLMVVVCGCAGDSGERSEVGGLFACAVGLERSCYDDYYLCYH